MTSDIDKRPPPPRDDKLTRIAVRHVWFEDNNITFHGIDSQYSSISNLKTFQEGNANRYVTCDWIPAWQMFEFSFHALNMGKDEVRVRNVSAACVAIWQREDGGR